MTVARLYISPVSLTVRISRNMMEVVAGSKYTRLVWNFGRKLTTKFIGSLLTVKTYACNAFPLIKVQS